MDILRSITEEYKKDDIPAFGVGDTVKVHIKIKEGNRERIQVFEGFVLKKQNGGISLFIQIIHSRPPNPDEAQPPGPYKPAGHLFFPRPQTEPIPAPSSADCRRKPVPVYKKAVSMHNVRSGAKPLPDSKPSHRPSRKIKSMSNRS